MSIYKKIIIALAVMCSVSTAFAGPSLIVRPDSATKGIMQVTYTTGGQNKTVQLEDGIGMIKVEDFPIVTKVAYGGYTGTFDPKANTPCQPGTGQSGGTIILTPILSNGKVVTIVCSGGVTQM